MLAAAARGARTRWPSLVCGTAIVLGSFLGLVVPQAGVVAGRIIDPTVLALVALLFFEVRFGRLTLLATAPRLIGVAWLANFVVIPTIAFAITSLFLSGSPLLFTGVMIYLVAPCTDWFLGFTRMAGGNTDLGAVLLPIIMVTQLALYPVVLWLFAREQIPANPAGIAQVVLQWFVAPAVVAITARLLMQKVLQPTVFRRIESIVGRLIPATIAILIVEIFASNITVIADDFASFWPVLAAVFTFFVLTYFAGEALALLFRFEYPERALLVMTTSARNAPLMLALTVVALPDQPVIYAATIMGMLIEFPHLTVITQVLLRRRRASENRVEAAVLT